MTPRSVSRFLGVVALAAIAAGWVFAAVSVAANLVSENGGGTELTDSGGAGSFITVGLLGALAAGWAISRRRPDRWTGPILQLSAIIALVGSARFGGVVSAPNFAGSGVGPVIGGLWLAGLLLPAVLAVAEVEVHGRAFRGFLVGAATSCGLGIAVAVVAHGGAGANSTWWETSKIQAGNGLARGLFLADTVVVALSLAAVLGVLVWKFRHVDAELRRTLRPVAVPLAAWVFATLVAQFAGLLAPSWAVSQADLDCSLGGFNTPDGCWWPSFNTPATLVLQFFPVVTLMAVFAGVIWVELIEPRLARTRAGITLSAGAGSRDAQTYLAGAMGDPSVTVFFRSADGSGWLDTNGAPALLAEEDPERALTLIERSGREIGAIEYDASLAAEPETIELTVTAAALVIDNARLAVLSNARAEEARQLTARLISSADSAREEVQARLTRGPLPALAAIEADLADGGDLEGVARSLQDVAAQVRQISHGLYPAELTDGGLPAALTQAVEVPDRRYAPAIEVTAFLAADGDPGAHLTEQGGSLVITLSEPPSDAALLERVAVLGGSIDHSTIVLPLEG
jgi:hypothetical protein